MENTIYVKHLEAISKHETNNHFLDLGNAKLLASAATEITLKEMKGFQYWQNENGFIFSDKRQRHVSILVKFHGKYLTTEELINEYLTQKRINPQS